MVAVPQLLHYHHHLFSHQFPKTHLQRHNLTKRGSTFLTRMSISSDPRPLDRATKLTIISGARIGKRAKSLQYFRENNDFKAGLNHFPLCCGSKCSLAFVAPLEAILFDIDGTLCDSDPLHYYAFREMLQEVGFNGGVPITEEFFIENISGMHNEELCGVLFPDWDLQRARKFFEDKEDMFRRLASEQLEPMKGLHKLREWIENQGLKRAAVTNAPRPNGELLVSALDLLSFFEVLVIANECDRAKPFPDPYLKALQALNVSNKHAFVFEDSVSGVKAGVAAGMPVVGLGTRNPDSLLLDAGASFVIKDFGDPKLWEALEELEKKAVKQ